MSCNCRRVGATRPGKYVYLRLDGMAYYVQDGPAMGLVWAQNPRDGLRYQTYAALAKVYFNCVNFCADHIVACMDSKGIEFFGPAKEDRYVGGSISISILAPDEEVNAIQEENGPVPGYEEEIGFPDPEFACKAQRRC